MGNNDQLPPPPPPGPQPDLPPTQVTPVPPPPPAPGGPGAPVPPPAPPAVPQFSDAAPTTQLPPTQMYPAAGAGAPPPGAPPPTGVPPAEGGNNKLPWIIAGAVTVVAVIVVAIVLLTGDDNTSSSPSTTAETVVETTIAPTTTEAPQTTLVITAPPSTAPPVETTTADTLEPGVSVFTDDTNTFTVLMLESFETDTRPIDQDGVEIANVTGATDIDAFSQDDDHDTFGISVSVGPSDDMPSAEEVSIADPGESVCTDRTTESGYPTLLGDAEVLLLDGCGTEGQSAKVFMLLVFPDRGLTMAVYAQGPGPSNTDLLDFAQAVVESVVFL